MKHKVFDILIGKKLATFVPTYQLIDKTRLTADGDGIALDSNKFILIVINAIKKSNIMNLDALPLQIAESIKMLLSRDVESITIKEIETLLIVMRYYNYDIFVIGRRDLEIAPEDDIEYNTISYLIENFSSNTIGSSGFYSGYSRNYADNVLPIAYDYIDIFGLTKEASNYLEMDLSDKAYELLYKQGDMTKFDDTRSLDFVLSAGFKYLVFEIV